jgi:hypothetical protein
MTVEPSNDFPRPRPSGWRQHATRGTAAIAVGGAMLAAAWTLSQADAGIWPIARAASAVAIDEWMAGSGPRYGPGGLERPIGYERWVSVGTSLGLGYSSDTGSVGHEHFHQVLIDPGAFEAFKKTGTFPDGTMLALEIAATGSRVLPARRGLFADTRVALEVAVKDRRRSKDGWAYYSFGDGTRATATPLPASACFSCHRAHAATDNVFTQFYPRLRKRMGD